MKQLISDHVVKVACVVLERHDAWKRWVLLARVQILTQQSSMVSMKYGALVKFSYEGAPST